MRAFLQVMRGLIDELTDQRAYRCHLVAHGAVDSPQEWRRFCDERWQAKATKGSCC